MSERVGASDKRQGWHWSDYWRNGRAEVMTIDSAAGAAPLDTAAFWRANLHGIVTGERVLDLATGSGQVAGYAAQVAAECGETAEVIGVDYADIAANARPLPTGVTLKGGVALEALPFEAAQFDVATSQFGIEYADHRAALAELARVCRPGARVFLLLHHADSPQLPGGYAAMFVLALCPPLWFRIVDPRVRAFREQAEARTSARSRSR